MNSIHRGGGSNNNNNINSNFFTGIGGDGNTPSRKRLIFDDSLFVPPIATLITEEVERISAKNNLNFHDLLTGFSTESSYRFRSANSSYELNDFRIRFIDANDMASRPLSLTQKYINQDMAPTSDEIMGLNDFGVVRVKDLKDIDSALTRVNDDNMPWLVRFRKTFVRSLHYLEFEMLEYPSLLVLAVASTNSDPVACFEELSSGHYLPQVFQTGQFDPSPQQMPKIYLLIHDVNDAGNTVDPTEILNQMKSTFPASFCKLLKINSLSPNNPNLDQADLWKDKIDPPFFQTGKKAQTPVSEVRGCCLSSDDFINLHEFVKEVTSKYFIQAMEKRIFSLNTIYTNAKKGMKNFVKSFWRKPKDASDGHHTDTKSGTKSVHYRYDQIESQVRLLADSCFLMQDYETALSMYTSVKADFKSDKAWIYYAGVNEMIMLCLAMLPDGTSLEGRYRRDIEHNFENCFASYMRKADEDSKNGEKGTPLCARLATRASILAANICTSFAPINPALYAQSPQHFQQQQFIVPSSRYLDAAEILIRASKRETIQIKAVLLEFASWYFLRGNFVRKFAFYISQAGAAYRQASQTIHSVRCYGSAVTMYEGTSWVSVQDHIDAILAKDLFTLERQEVALYFLLRIIYGGRQSMNNQQQYLQQFLEICKERPRATLAILNMINLTGYDIFRNADSIEENLRASEAVLSFDEPVVEVQELALPRFLDDDVYLVESTFAENDTRCNDTSISSINNHQLSMSNSGASNTVVGSDGEIRRVNEWENLHSELKNEIIAFEQNVKISEYIEMMTNASSISEQNRNPYLSMEKNNKFSSRAMLEPILLVIDIVNPMSLHLNLSFLQIVAEFEEDKNQKITDSLTMNNDIEEDDDFLQNLRTATGINKEFVFPLGPRKNKNKNRNFLVNLQDLTLAPDEHKTVTLKISPLRIGTLKIEGIRWLLFDTVWGFHKISLKGTLLQKTTENRANRMRAPDTRLISTIVPEMPLINVSLFDLPSVALKGEICRASMEFTNVGLAPADKFFIKLSHGWISFSKGNDETSTDHDGGDVHTPLQNCVGVTGTMFKLGNGENFVLSKGQKMKIPIWFRGQGIGEFTINILIRYSRAGEESKGLFRYVKLQHHVTLLPCLTLRAAVLSSYSNSKEYLMQVEITNNRSDQVEVDTNSINLHNIYSLSRFWIVEPAVDSLIHQDDSIIDSHDRIIIHLRLKPVDEAGVSSTIVSKNEGIRIMKWEMAGKSTVSGGDISLDELKHPKFEFLCLENLSNVFKVKQAEHRYRLALAAKSQQSSGPRGIAEIRRQNQQKEKLLKERTASIIDDNDNPSSLLGLCPRAKSLINLVMNWSTLDGKRGESYVNNFVVRPSEMPRTGPLIITVDYKSEISHKFSHSFTSSETKGSCVVDVTVSVQNRMAETSDGIDFTFEANNAPRSMIPFGSASQKDSVQPPNFMWLGNTCRTIKGVEPGTRVQFHLKALFLRPGIFDLNRFRFHLHPTLKGSTEQQTFIFPAQYLINIINTEERHDTMETKFDSETMSFQSPLPEQIISQRKEIEEKLRNADPISIVDDIPPTVINADLDISLSVNDLAIEKIEEDNESNKEFITENTKEKAQEAHLETIHKEGEIEDEEDKDMDSFNI